MTDTAPIAEDLPVPVLLARGVARALAQRGYATLTEFSLANGRRADVMGLGRGGELVIVEVKSSVQDFRSDAKWPEYREFCDRFYFAVAEDFPQALIPGECGLIVADAFGAAILRESPVAAVPAARRKSVILRFALLGSDRLRRLLDPAAGDAELF
jgi:hypothetical protein